MKRIFERRIWSFNQTLNVMLGEKYEQKMAKRSIQVPKFYSLKEKLAQKMTLHDSSPLFCLLLRMISFFFLSLFDSKTTDHRMKICLYRLLRWCHFHTGQSFFFQQKSQQKKITLISNSTLPVTIRTIEGFQFLLYFFDIFSCFL